MLTKELIAHKKSPNRLGTKYKADFVKEALDDNDRDQHDMFL